MITNPPLEQFTTRTEEEAKIYQADPILFVNEHEAFIGTESSLEITKQNITATIAFWCNRMGVIKALH